MKKHITQSSSNYINEGTNSNSVYTDFKGEESIVTSNYVDKSSQSDSSIKSTELEDLNGYDYYYQVNSSLNDLKKLYKNNTFIDILPSELDLIYEEYGLNKENDNLYIYIKNFISEDTKMAISNYNYKITLENGTELNLSKVKEDLFIDFYIPIKNFDLAHFNYSLYFQKQGYDIYDKKSNFYHEICSPAYLGENDITLKDRRKYIFPNNVTLCKDNCEYKGVEIKEKRIICSCNINTNTNYENNQQNNFFEKEEDNGNFVSYFLDNINYKIFKCYNLISSFENLKNNYAFYTILGVFTVILCLNFIIFYFSLNMMLKKMIMETPTSKKVREKIIQQLLRLKHNNENEILNPLKKRKASNNTTLRKSLEKYSISNNSNISNQNSSKEIRLVNKSKTSKPSKLGVKSLIKDYKLKKKKIESRKIQREKQFIKNENEILKKTIEKKNIKVNINELPFTQAIKYDKRNIFQMLYSFLIIKFELINLFYEKSNIKIILIVEYILFLLINFFFNTLLYSDGVVSHKYHNNGELDIFVTIFLSLLSNLITTFICYYIKYSRGINERMGSIKEIKRKKFYLYNVIKFFRYLKHKFICFLISEIIIVSSCYYYIVIFCIVYSRSKASLIVNYLSSLIEELIISVAITLLIIITRKIGLSCFSKNLYNTSKYINLRL